LSPSEAVFPLTSACVCCWPAAACLRSFSCRLVAGARLPGWSFAGRRRSGLPPGGLGWRADRLGRGLVGSAVKAVTGVVALRCVALVRRPVVLHRRSQRFGTAPCRDGEFGVVGRGVSSILSVGCDERNSRRARKAVSSCPLPRAANAVLRVRVSSRSRRRGLPRCAWRCPGEPSRKLEEGRCVDGDDVRTPPCHVGNPAECPRRPSLLGACFAWQLVGGSEIVGRGLQWTPAP
jgi:hypothetical protein